MSNEQKRKISETQKGKKLSEEHRKKISEGNKGKTSWNKGLKTGPRSEETKRKISKANKGKKNGFYGRYHSEETKRKLSESHKGKTTWMKGKHHSDEAKAKLREARLKQVLPMKDTSIEIAMHGELGGRGIVFEKHVPLLGKYQADIKIGDLVVECDGNYWHSFPVGLEKDRRRDSDLREAGYTVLRFWESEINNNVSHCVDMVETALGFSRRF